VTGRSRESGQATVEVALMIPVVVLLVLLVLQAGMAVRDRLVVLQATRVAARAVIVEPTRAAASAAVTASGAPDRVSVSLSGDLDPGGLATVTATMPASAVPLVGRVVAGEQVSERLVVRIE
jgi:Flp pilus assembly protein TadG